MKITNPRLKKILAFIKEYRHLIYMYIIYAVALTIIFSQTNCAPSKLKYRSLIKGGKVYVTIRVTLYTTSECYYCDVARDFLKRNQIRFIEKNFDDIHKEVSLISKNENQEVEDVFSVTISGIEFNFVKSS